MSQIQPRTFDDLNNLIVQNKLQTGRSYGNQKLYEAYLKYVPRGKKLDEPNEAGMILDAQQAHNKCKYKITTTSFLENYFSYNFVLEYLPLVKHYLLFFKSWDNEPNQIRKDTEKWIKAIWGKDLDYCFFINEPKNRSLHNRPHAHVFIDFSNYKQ